VIAALGAYGVIQHPSVFAAVNPLYGLEYLSNGGLQVFWCSAGCSFA
jgi:KUP system potassium uptake protein